MNKTRRRFLSNVLTYSLLLIGMVIVLLPFWYMLITSLKPQSFIFEIPPRLWPAEVTLTNYRTAL